MFSVSAVPHTMFSSAEVLHTMLVPHTTLVLQTMLAPETAPSGVRPRITTEPYTRFVDQGSVSMPNVVLSDSGETLHGFVRVSSARVSATAPTALISPAPCATGPRRSPHAEN